MERVIPKVQFMEVAIKGNQGAVRKIDVPTSLEYIDLGKYCDFLSWVLRIDKWLNELYSEGGGKFNPLDPLFMKAYISQMARAVQAFGIIHDPGELEHIPLGDYDKHIQEFFKVKTPGMINLDKTQDTLIHIYHNLFAIVQSYQPRTFKKDMIFDFRGHQFVIPKLAKDRLTKKTLVPGVTTQEAIEILDLQGRVFRDTRSKEFNGDLMFTQFLEQMSVLARPPGEDLPGGDVELDQLVEKRKLLFAGQPLGDLPGCDPISAALAIDVDFFLSMQLGLLRMTLKHVFSSTINTRSPETVQKVKQLKKQKPETKT